MHVIHGINVPIKHWAGQKQSLFGSTVPDIEEQAVQQLLNTSSLPFIHKNGLAVMPDVHYGLGATVGSVIATRGAVIPAAVGVDIGCGMEAVRLPIKASDLPENLRDIRSAIERDVPVGFAQHKIPVVRNVDSTLAIIGDSINRDYSKLNDKAMCQMGTLGGGNHFIELCLDEEQNVWIMLHSGSRGVGNIIGTEFIEIAKKKMEQYFIKLPDANLAYLPDGTPEFENYVNAVGWAQEYAAKNRNSMMRVVVKVLRTAIPIFDNRAQKGMPEPEFFQHAISCHHNYIQQEHHFGENLWITRKGAIRARKGDLGIIPGSMGQRSYIVRGKGNAESYCSCSHGAGRRMSRNAARDIYSVEDVIKQTEGVECKKDASVIDEIPAAYKDIDQVMANQSDLVEVVHTLKQVLCVKG